MRAPLLVLLLLAILGVAGWLAFADDDGPALPDTPKPTVEAPAGPATPQSGSQPDRTDLTPTPVVPKAAETPATTPPQDEPKLPANVLLRVRDVTTRDAVPAFRWRFRSGTADLKGDGVDGAADLTLPTDNLGTLLVECEGYEPYSKQDLTPPAAPSPASTVDLFLVPAQREAGITLHVHDLGLQPIRHLRVDAFAITEQNRQGAFWLTPMLWARRASSPDGAYRLPDLQPGEYGIRVYAVDENDELLPLLPYARTFTLTGSNGFLEDVPLEPGALLAIDLLDNANQPYDPSKFGVTTLSMRFPGGPSVQRKWLVRSQGIAASANDVVPGIGTVRLAEAVPAGMYQFEVIVQGGDPRVQRQIALRPGMLNTERILVP